MTTSISSEAHKLLMDIGKKFTTEQCHTINIKLDEIGKSRNFTITQPLKSLKIKNLGIDLALQLIDKS